MGKGLETKPWEEPLAYRKYGYGVGMAVVMNLEGGYPTKKGTGSFSIAPDENQGVECARKACRGAVRAVQPMENTGLSPLLELWKQELDVICQRHSSWIQPSAGGWTG